MAGLFVAIAHANYSLTNLATLKGWPVALSFIDIAWGGAASAAPAAAGKRVLGLAGRRLSARPAMEGAPSTLA